MNSFHILLCIAIQSITMFAHDAWQTKLHQLDAKALIKTLGYNPEITVTQPAPNVIHGDAVTVYAHAWGDSKESVHYFRNNSLMLPGTIVSFNFRDAHRGSSLPPIEKVRFSNFAQESDIATLLTVIKTVLSCGVTAINLFGHSRGGGAIITMLARLYQFDTYYNSFNKLGITKENATAILNAVNKGSLVLNCPLVDTPQLIKEKASWVHAGFMSGFLSRGILPFIMQYRAYADNPVTAAQILQKNGYAIPTFIHFQKDDIIIGTRNDYLLYQYLHGKDTYLTIGNEGSHLHPGIQLGKDLQPFYKKYGNACYQDAMADENSLNKAQPNLAELKNIFQDIQKFQRSGIIQYGLADKPSAWQQALTRYDLKPIENALGYNPQIRVYQNNDPLVQNNDQVTVYVHGLGEHAQTVIPYYKLNSSILPGTVVGFDFPDVVPGSFATYYSKLSLAQSGDIATLASVLKILDDCGLETIHLFGTSRGGGTIVNTLARLIQWQKYKEFFTNLDITEQQATSILHKIKKGTIVLNVSMVDSNEIAKEWGSFGYAMLNYILPRLTAHRKTEDQAIDGATIMQPQQFNILVHFEHKDERVGNRTDAAFYKNIMGQNTYLVLADDGGHLHNGFTLGRVIQAFRKRHGGAYYPNDASIQEDDLLLQESPSKKEDVDAFVADSYAYFERLRKLRKR